jgi:hypothetical protein
MRRSPSSVVVALVLVTVGCSPPAAPEADLPPARVVEQVVGPGCDVADVDEGVDRSHVAAADAPPASVLYRQVPPTGGRHFAQVHPLVVDAMQPADVRATTHNLEHGAVLVHVDAARLGAETARAVEAWAEQLGAAGFRNVATSAGVLVVAMPQDATTDAAVALRAWGRGLDCDGWDRVTADAFVTSSYGDRGEAPERELAPYPEDNDVLLEDGPFV